MTYKRVLSEENTWTGSQQNTILKRSETTQSDIYGASPDKVVSVDVGTDHFHAAGVDQGLDATLHTGIDHILRS